MKRPHKKMVFILGVIITCLFGICINTGCVRFRAYRIVSFEQITKMPSFNATVEDIRISPNVFNDPDVTINLKQKNGGERFSLQFFPANTFVINFANYIQKGKTYNFPGVFEEFVGSQTNNSVR